MGHSVHRPVVAKQQHHINPQAFEQRLGKSRPLIHGAAIRNGAARVKKPITRIEIDLVHLRASAAQIGCQPLEKRPHRPLQQQHPFVFELLQPTTQHSKRSCNQKSRDARAAV